MSDRHRRRGPRAAVLAVVAGVLVAAGCSGSPRLRSAEGDGQDVRSGGSEAAAPTTLAADGTTATTVAGVAPDTPGATTPGVGDAGATGGTGSAGAGTATGVTTATAPPMVPGGFRSTLFADGDDRRGITADEIRICAHAALTYGSAFNTSAADLNVYWTAVNDAGGVHGRRVTTTYENDNYTPTDAVKAATACKDKYDPFLLIGGIGFDQIPAVRVWAEQNRVLYLHHTATENGAADKRRSFTMVPTTERVGEMFGQLAAWRFAGKKVGIVKRSSENWEPGVVAFKRDAKARGIDVVLERGVPNNKGSYLQDVVDLRNAGAEVVWVWLNALETVQFIGQTQSQNWHPSFMVFPFNLESQTLQNDALQPPIVGVAMYNAYSRGDYSGEFAKYADDMRQFEAQYAKYRPNADIGGLGGDLLFLNWQGQKVLHQLLLECGRDCSRNRFVELLHGYRKPIAAGCSIDFTRAGTGNDRRGGWQLNVLEAYRAPSGKVNFRNIRTCVEQLP